MDYFYSPYLPVATALQKKYDDLVIKYAELNKYLYVTSLHKLLDSLTKSDQKSFMVALENSESLAQKWLQGKTDNEQLLTEHLERNILALDAQLL